MDNEIQPTVGSWYQYMPQGRTFQVVAVDDDESVIELQHFDGDIEEVSLNEWHGWDLEAIEAPEDWTGPVDEVQQGDLGYSEMRSEAERRGQAQGRGRNSGSTNDE